jgi:class 3 adenylate cyclase
MSGMIERGALHPLTFRFRDDDLEAGFQIEEGAAGLGGYRIITGATAVLWAMAAFIIPLETNITVGLSMTAGMSMAVVGTIAFAASAWARTMNRQHALASILTSANGLVLLLLAFSGDAVEGFAVAAIMLLFLFGFVSRTRFVFAVFRTVVIAAGFAVVVAVYDSPGGLLLDSFIFAAASIASLVGLRLLERNRRRVWHQRLVIEEQSASIEAERSESERLLLNVLPAAVSKRLKQGENPIADDFSAASVIFADIVGFTPMASSMAAPDVITMLSGLFSMFDDLVVARGLEKIKTIGDSYMAVGGLPEPIPDHAVRVVDLARAMLKATEESDPFGGLSLRIGVNSGPVAGGVIGTQKFAYDVWGNTVNVAARLEKAGVPGRVHVSEATMQLTRETFGFEARGETQLRGVGVMKTYLLLAEQPTTSPRPDADPVL